LKNLSGLTLLNSVPRLSPEDTLIGWWESGLSVNRTERKDLEWLMMMMGVGIRTDWR
jgi:hypothetical protein